MITNNFIAINLIDNDKPLTEFPIIYYWDGSGELNDFFNKDKFLQLIKEKIDIHSFLTVKAYLIYAYTDDVRIDSIKKIYEIKDVISLSKLPELSEKYIKYVIDYLYAYSFKEENNSLSIIEAYNKIKEKHPNKVTEDVLNNYIKVKLKEDFSSLTEENISDIIEKWKHMI